MASADDIRLQLSHVLLAPDYLLGKDSLAGSEATYIEQLAPILRASIETAKTDDLLDALRELEAARENDIRVICEDDANPLLGVADQLEGLDAQADDISVVVREVTSDIKRTGNDLLEKSSFRVGMDRTLGNIESALDATHTCLQALEHTNQVLQLLKSRNKIAAVQSLYELQNMGLDRMQDFGLANMISRTVPALTNEIIRASLDELDTHLKEMDTQLDAIGQRGEELLAKQQDLWAQTVAEEGNAYLQPFRFNSPVELAYRESTKNYMTDANFRLDLGPLYEAELVLFKLDKIKALSNHVAEQRQDFLAGLLPPDGEAITAAHMRKVAGFCIAERLISRQLPKVHSAKLVDDIWEQLVRRLSALCARYISTLKDVNEDLVPFRNVLATFVDILKNFDFSMTGVMGIMRELLQHTADRLVDASCSRFLNYWRTEDSLPLVVNGPKLYNEVLAAVWYKEPNENRRLSYPRVFPFSKLYSLTCADLRSLITHISLFFDQFQQEPTIVEDILTNSVDKLLTDTVCKTLVDSLRTSKREQIVQVLIDLEYFELAAIESQKLLKSLRMSWRKGPTQLKAPAAFEQARRTAESRVFVLVEKAVDDFVSVEEVDWFSTEIEDGPATFVLDLTAYLATLTNSTLARLPLDVRTMAYLGAGDHLQNKLLEVLESAPDGLTIAALRNFETDINFLQQFFDGLAGSENNAGLAACLTEVTQTLKLALAQDPTAEYSDSHTRMTSYDRVDKNKVSRLLMKIHRQPATSAVTSPRTPQAAFMKYWQDAGK